MSEILETVDRLNRAKGLFRAIELGINGLQMPHERDALASAIDVAMEHLLDCIERVTSLLDKDETTEEVSS